MKRIFFTGLAAIVPIVITIYVVVSLFTFADGIVGPSINKYLCQHLGYTIPGMGIIIPILIIFIVGLLFHISRMRFRRWMERMFHRIPLVNKIYGPVKSIVDFLFFPARKGFRYTVLVEYPRKGVYSIGFVTNEISLPVKGKENKKLCHVYIPSSPSPITGFTLIVPEEEMIHLDISIEQAMRVIVSGGLINLQ